MLSRRRKGARLATLATLLAVALAAALSGCSQAAHAPGTRRGTRRNTAVVATAGALQYLNQQRLGRAFSRATGWRFQSRSAGGVTNGDPGELHPNVVESIGQHPSLPGNRSRWYVQFAATELVIAYDPASKYGAQLAAIAHSPAPRAQAIASLFPLLAQPGFRLGRTDPNTDPQGAAFIEMLELAQKAYHLPSATIGKILRAPADAASSPQIFTPGALVQALQSGQVDAISAYRSEALALHLRYIPLTQAIDLGYPSRAGLYNSVSLRLANGTVTRGQPLVVNIATLGKPSPAATAFVQFVLSPGGLILHAEAGYRIYAQPAAFGSRTALQRIPRLIRQELEPA